MRIARAYIIPGKAIDYLEESISSRRYLPSTTSIKKSILSQDKILDV